MYTKIHFIYKCIQKYILRKKCILRCSERKKITPTPNQANDLFARYETAKRKQTGAVKKRGKKATKKRDGWAKKRFGWELIWKANRFAISQTEGMRVEEGESGKNLGKL